MGSERVFPGKLISSWNWKQLSQATEECLRAGWRGAAARRNEMKQEIERSQDPQGLTGHGEEFSCRPRGDGQSLVGSRRVTFTTCRLLDPGHILLRLPSTPEQRRYRPGGWAVTCAVLSHEHPADSDLLCSHQICRSSWRWFGKMLREQSQWQMGCKNKRPGMFF